MCTASQTSEMHTTGLDGDSLKHTDFSPLPAGAHFLIFKIESETGETAQRAKELATKPDDLDPQNPHSGRREMIPTNPLTPPPTHTHFFFYVSCLVLTPAQGSLKLMVIFLPRPPYD